MKDARGREQVGPSGLRRALLDTKPCPVTGARIAVSVPDGRYIAVQLSDDPQSLVIRKLGTQTGHSGTVTEEGDWVSAEGFRPTTWRPA
jgi:hypothetical protein